MPSQCHTSCYIDPRASLCMPTVFNKLYKKQLLQSLLLFSENFQKSPMKTAGLPLWLILPDYSFWSSVQRERPAGAMDLGSRIVLFPLPLPETCCSLNSSFFPVANKTFCTWIPRRQWSARRLFIAAELSLPSASHKALKNVSMWVCVHEHVYISTNVSFQVTVCLELGD